MKTVPSRKAAILPADQAVLTRIDANTPELQLTGRFHVTGTGSARFAWSGEGILRNARGDTVNPVPSILGQVLPPSPIPSWNFSRWIPQAVVIKLETNDFLTGIPNREAFIGTYCRMIETVDQHYQSPHFFCCLGPMITDAELAVAHTYLKEIEQHARENGIRRFQRVNFDTLRVGELGADSHPNLSGHRRMAIRLTEAIRQAVNW